MNEQNDFDDACGCTGLGEPDHDNLCDATDSAGYGCAKAEGHDGPHAACLPETHPFSVWTDDGYLKNPHPKSVLESDEVLEANNE